MKRKREEIPSLFPFSRPTNFSRVFHFCASSPLCESLEHATKIKDRMKPREDQNVPFLVHFLSKIVGCSNHSALIVHDEMSGGFSLAFLSRITFMRPIKLDKALNRLAYVSSTQLAPLAKKLVRSTCSKSSACQVNCPSS